MNVEIVLIQIEGFDTGEPHKTRKMTLRRQVRFPNVPRKGETMRFVSKGEDMEREIAKVVWLAMYSEAVATLHLQTSMCKDTETFDRREANWIGAGFTAAAKESMDDKHMEWVRKGDHLTDG